MSAISPALQEQIEKEQKAQGYVEQLPNVKIGGSSPYTENKANVKS